jgi:hypothetical protein
MEHLVAWLSLTHAKIDFASKSSWYQISREDVSFSKILPSSLDPLRTHATVQMFKMLLSLVQIIAILACFEEERNALIFCE